jgi:phosphatidylserine/phosphatidylglycerophosphate/cardiolipin synthase-like enzyme
VSDTKPIEPVSPPNPEIKPPEPITPPPADGGIKGIEGAAAAPGRDLRNKAARPYFLKEDRSSDPMQTRFAARDIDSIVPLIDGITIFKELENAITAAKSSVLLAYWAIDLSTRMVTDSDQTWVDMLVYAATSGVKVRVLMNDFDPAFQRVQHMGAWFQLGTLLYQGRIKKNASADALQVIVARHAAEVPPALVGAAAPNRQEAVAAEMNALADSNIRKNAYLYSPGLWDRIAMDPKSAKMSPAVAHKAYPAWPGSHHQKLAVIDGRVALTGGANITDQYVDSDKHDKPVDKDGIGPWHDAYVKIEGAAIIRDFVMNYVELWNQGKASMDAFLARQTAALKIKPTPYYATVPTTVLKESDIPIVSAPASTTAPAIPAQIRRTVSTGGTSTPFFTNVRRDVLDGYLLAIGLAEEFIYIENQYLREEKLGNAIIDRHKQKSDLRTIIVIPTRSEEKIRKTGDAISKSGAALQHQIVDDMQRQLGSRVGFFALERSDAAIVYVHSKLLIVDDKLASIGSANANPRSFFMDTELDLVWFDEKTVPALRLKLWREILGNPRDVAGWKPRDYVKKWTEIAAANKVAKGAKLKGFVRPFVNDAEGDPGLLNLGPYS